MRSCSILALFMVIQTATLCAADSPTLKPAELSTLITQIKNAKTDDESLAGLTRLGDTKFSPVPPEVSGVLVEQSILSESAAVRRSAAEVIKKLDDKNAMKVVFNGMLNEKWKPEQRKRGAEAMRFIDNPEMVHAMVELATLVLKVGTSQFGGIETVFIKPPDGNTGGATPQGGNAAQENGDAHNAAITDAIRLPIELPTLELKVVNTAVAVYAVEAMKTFAKRDIGDRMGWKPWFDDWKHIRDVRLAQAANPVAKD